MLKYLIRGDAASTQKETRFERRSHHRTCHHCSNFSGLFYVQKLGFGDDKILGPCRETYGETGIPHTTCFLSLYVHATYY